MLSVDDHVSRVADVLFSAVDEELLAIDAATNSLFSLNPTAGRVWELIEAPVRIGDVCASMCREFAVDEATCLRDVLELLERLHSAGIVTVHAAHM